MPLPTQLQPQLATLVDSPPGGDWRYEVKFDGYRILARIDGDDVRLFTRNGHDWSSKLPRQVAALRALGIDAAWLDGEVVVAGENGAADFRALQNAFDTEHDEHITYYLFDLPFLGGGTCASYRCRTGAAPCSTCWNTMNRTYSGTPPTLTSPSNPCSTAPASCNSKA